MIDGDDCSKVRAIQSNDPNRVKQNSGMQRTAERRSKGKSHWPEACKDKNEKTQGRLAERFTLEAEEPRARFSKVPRSRRLLLVGGGRQELAEGHAGEVDSSPGSA